jgi:hypothetical protein
VLWEVVIMKDEMPSVNEYQAKDVIIAPLDKRMVSRWGRKAVDKRKPFSFRHPLAWNILHSSAVAVTVVSNGIYRFFVNSFAVILSFIAIAALAFGALDVFFNGPQFLNLCFVVLSVIVLLRLTLRNDFR